MDPKLQILFECLKTAGVFVTALGVIFAFRQLRLANQQFKATVTWNKVNAPFALFNNQSFIDREGPAASVLKDLDINLYEHDQPLAESVVQQIVSDPNKLRPVKELLNYLEHYAVAVNTEIIDDATAFDLISGLMIRYHRVFRPLIRARRVRVKSLAVWIELQKLCLKWDKRLADTEKQLLEGEIQAEAAERAAQSVGDGIRSETVAKTGAKPRYVRNLIPEDRHPGS